MKPKALISWSSGKDAAWALHRAREEGEYEVAGAITTITGDFGRVSMTIPSPCPNEIYEARMGEAIRAARANGISKIIFGDLYLEDIRAYREEKLHGTGIEAVFPLWKIPTYELAREMIAGGLRARVVCLNPRKMPCALAGKAFDEELLAALPPGVDPCAENGEFHTCVVGGPMFSKNLEVNTGEIVERDGFVFADLTLA
jgi:diphthamide synthase (EF-2-diphthine--ammonia ligase)